MGFYNDLRRNNRHIVIDTSILSHDCPDRAPQYRGALEFLFDSGKLYTVPDVFREARRYLKHHDPALLENVRKHCIDKGKLSTDYFINLFFLIPEAERRGIIDDWKKHPLTDVEVAALTLTLGRRGPTALLSGDRKLNELVQDEVDRRRLRDTITVYSFLPSRAWLKPYLQEKHFTYDTPRRAVSSFPDRFVPRGAIAQSGA